MKGHKLSLGAFLAAAALFAAVHLLSNVALTGARLDLTEGKLFTLSEGSRNVAAGLVEPIDMRLYVSERTAAEIPVLATYKTRVRELLDEFVAASGGKLRLEVIDPEPFSEEEDQAVQDGVQGLLVDQGGDLVYFGLVASNAVDERAVVPYLRPEQEQSLEYDIARMLYKLDVRARPRVGLMSSLPLTGTPQLPIPGAPPPTPAWMIHGQITDLFDVVPVETTVSEIPDDLDVLMIVHPKALGETTLFAIDQYVLGGGNALVFVDPHCEADNPPTDPNNPMAAMMAPRGSSLEPLLSTWGVEMAGDKVLADRKTALRVTSTRTGRPELVDYVVWLQLEAENLNADDFVMQGLGALRAATTGRLRPRDGAGVEVTPLIRSSDESSELDLSMVQFMPDPKRLLADFMPSGEEALIAVRVQGEVVTAFPEGPPGGGGGEADEDPEAEPTWLTQSDGPVQLIVVADADLLADRWWVETANLFGSRLAIPTASNADFVAAALDNLSGSDDLIAVRSRTRFDRPFTVIEDIAREADQRLLAVQQDLETRLRETEGKIRELEAAKPEGGSVLLSPEQQAEIDRFQADRLDIRRQLREVKHEMIKDIDRLQSQVTLVNVALVPLLVVFAALGLASWRRRRGRA